MRSWLIPFPSHAGATQARTAFHCSGGSQKRAPGCALVPARNSPSPYRVLVDLGLPAVHSTMRTYYGQYRCWWPFLCSAACVRGTGVLYDALSPVHTTVQYTLHLPPLSLSSSMRPYDVWPVPHFGAAIVCGSLLRVRGAGPGGYPAVPSLAASPD